jgi:hypothetical protein
MAFDALIHGPVVMPGALVRFSAEVEAARRRFKVALSQHIGDVIVMSREIIHNGAPIVVNLSSHELAFRFVGSDLMEELEDMGWIVTIENTVPKTLTLDLETNIQHRRNDALWSGI